MQQPPVEDPQFSPSRSLRSCAPASAGHWQPIRSRSNSPNVATRRASTASSVHGEEVVQIEAATVVAVKTSRGGVQLCINGFTMNKNRQTASHVYWECVYRRITKTHSFGCTAKATTTTTVAANEVYKLIHHGDHNHAPKAEDLHLKRARAYIRNVAATTKNKPSQILQEQTTSEGGDAKLAASSMPTKNAFRKSRS